jgi:AraC family transcriptional regulator
MSRAGAIVDTGSLVVFRPPHIVKRQMTAWNGLKAEAVQIVDCQRVDYSFRGPQHLLIASERVERNNGETCVEGLRSTLRDLTRKLTFIPANSRFHGWQEPRAPARVSFFYIDPNGPLLDPRLAFDSVAFEPRLFFFDADIWETARKLAAQIGESRPSGALYAEALGAVLCHELVRLNGGRRGSERSAIGALAAWQKKRVEQFVADHLAERVSLSTMAELARLSPYHFSRAFKRTFGVPPHRYHLMRRVEEAKILLARADLSVTEIGARLGFAQTSAFTFAFHKMAGASPTQYRRALE